MDVFITRLRKLLAADPSVEIMNVHSTGYKLLTP
jgi:DNA-binding response OmpR family regulator